MVVGDSDSSRSDSSGSLGDNSPPSYTDLTQPPQQVSSEQTETGLGDETAQRDTELVQISFTDSHPTTTVLVNPSAPLLPVERHPVAPYGQGADMGVVMPLPQQAEPADQIPSGGQVVPMQGGALHPVFFQPASGRLFISANGGYQALPRQFGVNGMERQQAPAGPTAPTAPVTRPCTALRMWCLNAQNPMGPRLN